MGDTSQIFVTWSLSATLNSGALASETAGSLSWSWGYGAGIHVEPWRWDGGKGGPVAFVVTLGVRRMFAGQLHCPKPGESNIAGQNTTVFSTATPHVDLLEPYLLLGIEGRSPERVAEPAKLECNRCIDPTWRGRPGIVTLRVCADDTRVSSGPSWSSW
jgi:hypothetical protein